MGACFTDRRFHQQSHDELRRQVFEEVARMRARHGSDPYSGTWATNDGLVIDDRLFDLLSEAEDWVGKRVLKRGPILAVRVKLIGDFAETAEGAARALAIGEAFGAWKDWPEGRFQALKDAGGTVVCPHCASTMPAVLVRSLDCPVCKRHHGLMSEDAKAESERLHRRIQELQEAYAAAEKAWASAQPESSWIWYLGALCAE